MIRDNGRWQRGSSGGGAAAAGARRKAAAPAVEALEGRQLLSFYSGPTSSRPVFSRGTVFTVTVGGGGYETIRKLRHGQVAINLYATNPGSTLTITAQPRQGRFGNRPLEIGQIKVKTGLLGAINAEAANLSGPMTALNGSLSTIAFNSIGRTATVDVNGTVGTLNAGAVNLGPTGRVHITGDLTGSFGGSLNLDGGQFIIDHNASGALTPASLSVTHNGILSVANDLAGGLNVAGDMVIASNGLVNVGHNLGSLNVGQTASLDGGRLLVGNDLTGAGTIGQGLSLSNNALMRVGRDVAAGLTVTGDLTLDTGGSFSVGRDLAGLTVGGNLKVLPAGGAVTVGGNLNGLTVTGALQGKGSDKSIDLAVGLNLSKLSVQGGGNDQGGIQDANIAVTKNIQGLDVQHGIFNSFITAGVLIDGAGSGGSGSQSNVGADGPDAVFNSEIRAGLQIRNLTLAGNVRSDFVTNPNPKGYRTRIVAGEDRQGRYLNGGNIDNFQITGTLIDSVLAASVAPGGGNGTLPAGGYGPPPVPSQNPGDLGNDTYDAPAGVIYGGPVNAPTPYINYSEITYFNETPTKVSYNTALDPTIDDLILPGSINPSFASTPLSQAQLANANVTVQTTVSSGGGSTQVIGTTTLSLPLPTKSTVLGGVISHTHGDDQDFAGIFAADTRGVFIGTLPDK